MATAKLKEFIGALIYYKDEHRRFSPFMIQIGILDGDVYSRALSDMAIMLLRRSYGETLEHLTSIAEEMRTIFENHNTGVSLVPETVIKACIVGRKASLDDPSTWQAPEFLAVATPDQIRYFSIYDAVSSK